MYNVLDTKGEGVGGGFSSHGGDFLEIWGGGGKQFMYNVLDTKGEGVGGVPPSHGGDFLLLEIWVLNTGFWMRYISLINIKS